MATASAGALSEGALGVMDEERGGGAANEGENGAARRLEALRALAQQQTQDQPVYQAQRTSKTGIGLRAPSAAGLPRASQPGPTLRSGGRARMLIVAALAVVVVATSVVAGARFFGARRAPAPATVLRITPIGCTAAVAWAPNGQEIAALGSSADAGCNSASLVSQSDALDIYSAVSGKLIEQLHPDPIVFDAPAVQHFVAANSKPSDQPASVNLQALTWTPDSQAVLLSFGVAIPLPEGGFSGVEPGIAGALRLGVSGATQTSVWIDTSSQATQNNVIGRWDLTTGKMSLTPIPPVATIYTWGSGGVLEAAGSAAGKPIGAPDHDASFSIWQPGSLQVAQGAPSSNGPPQVIPQDVQWYANLSAVSPDGRYYYPYFPAYGSVEPPSTVRVYPHEQAIEPHDKALVTLAQQLSAAAATAKPNVGVSLQDSITWRPDGRFLATLTVTNHLAGLPSLRIAIYDTTSGALVKSLTPNFAGLQTGPAGNAALAWSPDGKRLLLLDNLYGAITIWEPAALPA